MDRISIPKPAGGWVGLLCPLGARSNAPIERRGAGFKVPSIGRVSPPSGESGNDIQSFMSNLWSPSSSVLFSDLRCQSVDETKESWLETEERVGPVSATRSMFK